MSTPFTIEGRIVQGDVHKVQPPSKDPVTKQVKVDRTTGQPVQGQFYIAIAVAKNDPKWPAVKQSLDAEARTSWPQFFGQAAPGLQIGPELPVGCTNPKFANKIIDGDGVDDQGKPYSAKEGFAGRWVVKIASQYAPKVYEWTSSGWTETVHTGRVVKCGDYASISGNCVTNNSQQSPGMYMNLGAVAFEREGPEIKSAAAIDPNAAFGARGGPTTTAAAANPSGTVATGQTSQTASPGDAPAAPYTGYMEDTPAPPAGPQMTAKAGTTTYEAFRVKGWTDDQLRAQGYMA